MMIIKKHFAFHGENLIGSKYIIALHMYIAQCNKYKLTNKSHIENIAVKSSKNITLKGNSREN